MTGIAAVLAGTQVVAAVLIMIGVWRLGPPHADCCWRSSTGVRAFVAGATLWVLAELGSSPVAADLLSQLRPWLWVGRAAAAVGAMAVLIGALLVLTPRYRIDEGGTPHDHH